MATAESEAASCRVPGRNGAFAEAEDEETATTGGQESRRNCLHKEVRVTGLSGLQTEIKSLHCELRELRVLSEYNSVGLKRIAKVQVHHGQKLDDHGRKLDEITRALEPLARLDAFVRLVADWHEKRITDLERHTGVRE